MYRVPLGVCAAVLCLAASGLCQSRVSPEHRGERAMLVVPITGSGSWDDPRRPAFDSLTTTPGGLLEWSWIPSDDGAYAIVTVAAKHRAALTPLLNDRRVVAKVEHGKGNRQQAEAAIRAYKKNYRFDRAGGPQR